MLTRGRVSKSRAARAAAPSVSGDDALSPLPRDFLRSVFLRVPVQTRTHCMLVSRAWNVLLSDPSFWSTVDLSLRSGVPRFNRALFQSVVAKARGSLRDLDVTGRAQHGSFSRTHLYAAATDNATSLTNLRASGCWWTAKDARRLVDIVPEAEVESA